MIIFVYVSAVRVGNFGCNLGIYILKEKLSNWNGCKTTKKEIQKLLVKCENALERLRENSAEFSSQN